MHRLRLYPIGVIGGVCALLIAGLAAYQHKELAGPPIHIGLIAPPQAFPNGPLRGPRSWSTTDALPSPILSGMSWLR